MNLLRNATSQVIRFGPELDSTDGVTPETGLTIAQTDMQLSKDGGAFAQKNASGNATHDTDGWYSTTLNTTDTATNGILLLQINVTGALPVWHEFYVVPQASYDAFTTNGLNNVAATDIVSAGAITTLSGAIVNVDLVDTTTTVTGGATAASIAALNDVAATDIVSAGAITTSSGAVSSVTTVATTTTNTDMRGTDSALLAASINLTAGAVDNVTLVATTTTNSDMRGTDGVDTATMRGTDSALLAASINLTAGAVDNVTLVATTTTNTDMRGTDGANTVVPDAAGVAPTATEITADMDANSTQLAAIVLDTGTTLPDLIDDLAIKRNAAFPNFEFLVVLTSDHVTPATGLTVTGQRSIDGGAFTAVAGAIAEVSNGIYQFDALAADTNGTVITWRFSSATADDVFVTFLTVQ